jgi:hypothetical protein
VNPIVLLTLLGFLAIIAAAFGVWTLLSPPPPEQRGRGAAQARNRAPLPPRQPLPVSVSAKRATPPPAPPGRAASGGSDPFEEFLRHSKKPPR